MNRTRSLQNKSREEKGRAGPSLSKQARGSRASRAELTKVYVVGISTYPLHAHVSAHDGRKFWRGKTGEGEKKQNVILEVIAKKAPKKKKNREKVD